MIPPLAPIVVSGALGRVCGQPLEENPYDRYNAEEQWNAWEWAWRYADSLLEHSGREQIKRWLDEAEAA